VSCGVAQLILQELAGLSTTVENYVIDFDNNAVVFSHDGHGNPALAAPGTVKVKHSIYYTGVHGFGAGFEFAYLPGPVTNLALVPLGPAGWRFVISEGQFLDYTPRPVSAPQTLFRHDALRIAEWCTAWCKAGAPHHMAAAQGRWTSHLLALARMLQIEAVVV
jgi:L-arabinose isomerase